MAQMENADPNDQLSSYKRDMLPSILNCGRPEQPVDLFSSAPMSGPAFVVPQQQGPRPNPDLTNPLLVHRPQHRIIGDPTLPGDHIPGMFIGGVPGLGGNP